MTDLTSSLPALICWYCLIAMVPSLYLALGLETIRGLDRVYRGASLTQQIMRHFYLEPLARPSTRSSRLQTFLSILHCTPSTSPFPEAKPHDQKDPLRPGAADCLLSTQHRVRGSGKKNLNWRLVSKRLVCVESSITD